MDGRRRGARGVAVALVAALSAVVAGTAPVVGAVDGPLVSVGDQSGLERDEVTGSVFVPVFLSAPADESVVVSFATADGTAQAGSDYIRWGSPTTPRTVTVPAGSVQTTINVPVLIDDSIEADETFRVQIVAVSGAGAEVGDGEGTATIVDSDGLAGPNPVLTVSSGTVHEGDTGPRKVQFLLHLSRPVVTGVTVSYSTSDAGAVGGIDFVRKLPGSVVFAPGQLSKTIDVLVLADQDDRGDRSLHLEVVVTGGAPVEEVAMTGVATIVDDEPTGDLSPPSLSLPTGMSVPATGPAGATVTWNATAADEVDGQVDVECSPSSGGTFAAGTTVVQCSATDAAGNTATGSFPVQVTEWAPVTPEVTLGGNHSCALAADGTVSCWGSNDFGTLGAGPFDGIRNAAPVPGLTGVVDLDAGTGHTCAVLVDGTARCWGYDLNGELGDGSSGIDDASYVPTPVVGLTGATAISGGRDHTCAVISGGEARCWGEGGVGRLGHGSIVDSNVPVAVTGLSGAVEVSAGRDHTCAVLGDGTVRCWGENADGQLGTGTTTDSTVPVAVSGLTTAVSVEAGERHTCAGLADGTVRCWGANILRQLGTGTTTASRVPVAVAGVSDVTDLAAGYNHTCASSSDGATRCWGADATGQLGRASTTASGDPSAVSNLTDVLAVGAGVNHSCAMRSDDSVWCWGTNGVGQLANGTTRSESALPGPVAGMATVAWIAPGATSCAVLPDGTARCWGLNASGQLGDGTTNNSNVPVAVSGLSGATSVDIGGSFACALLSTGGAKCWGAGTSGQLGSGSANSSVPVSVPALSGATALSSGGSHSCALLSAGTVRCWGANASGQLGIGTNTSPILPTTVTGLSTVVALDAGSDSSCAVLADTTVRCWGANTAGKLGNGSTTSSNVPVTVSGITGAVSVAVGQLHACAGLADGTVRCWGSNQNGELGVGTSLASSSLPLPVVSIDSATSVVAGSAHTCALLADGTARCWGDNQRDQLGNPTLSQDSTSPVVVEGLTGATVLRAGSQATCAILAGGQPRCWGSNLYGGLGDGGGFSSVPTLVLSAG